MVLMSFVTDCRKQLISLLTSNRERFTTKVKEFPQSPITESELQKSAAAEKLRWDDIVINLAPTDPHMNTSLESLIILPMGNA